jgi:hypothetical protein
MNKLIILTGIIILLFLIIFMKESFSETNSNINNKMVFLTNLFITSDRKNLRYSSYDIFKYTLETYSRITWEDDMYFFVKFDTDYSDKKDDFNLLLKKLFPNNTIHLEYTRHETPEEWCPVLKKLIDKYGLNKPIFHVQSDDHPFIDIDTSVLDEGVKLMNEDKASYKQLSFSHWPEVIQNGLSRNYIVKGNYIVCPEYAQSDSNYVWNLNYFNLRLCKGEYTRNRRIDDVPNNINMKEAVQYVPLRELCRHFDGYGNIGIPLTYHVFEQLELPPKKIDFSKESIIKRIETKQNGYGAGTVIPENIEKLILKAYGY